MKPYNPLEKVNLGKSVAESLMQQLPIPLAKIDRFSGAGIYAIYYLGTLPIYAKMREWNISADVVQLPIYVGKAVPTGGRKGLIQSDAADQGTVLFRRLEEHRKSIENVENLDVNDFVCRYLVVDDIWIPLGESLLIQRHRPLWNSIVDGFGNHDPGSGRHMGARPSWDTLHSGRPWAAKCAQSKLSVEEIEASINEYWQTIEGI
jgi:hypothetical protein